MRPSRTDALSALWGFAEATVFFIVPDVLLSWLALESYRRALIACVYALAGALAGGTIIWFAGRSDPEPLRALFDTLPAVDYPMIDRVRAELTESGLVALFIGPLRGTPYKIYALEAAQLGFGFMIFLSVSVPARLIRFVIVSLAAVGLGQVLGRRLSLAQLRIVHVTLWTAFYAWFFYVLRNIS